MSVDYVRGEIELLLGQYIRGSNEWFTHDSWKKYNEDKLNAIFELNRRLDRDFDC